MQIRSAATKVYFTDQRDLLTAVVEMVFGWRYLSRRDWNGFRIYCSGLDRLPAWFRYLERTRKSPIWRYFSAEERIRAAGVLRRYFESVVDAPSRDINGVFFRAFEQQGCNFLTGLLPDLRHELGAESWSAVIRSLASVISDDDAKVGYNPKRSGSTRRPFFREIRKTTIGKHLISCLKKYPPGGRNGWQLFWAMMRACKSLQGSDYDFGKALRDAEVIGFLEKADRLDPVAALASWETRRYWFSAFVNGLPKVGWNTFDYTLRDLQYPGCLLLFKLDSTNVAFMQKIGADVGEDRTKYLEVLDQIGILARYPPAVVNVAIYAFSSREQLGYANRLIADGGGGFDLACG